MTSQPDSVDHDAQRRMEQGALRNVRGLVDKLEKDEAEQARHPKRMAAMLAIALALLILAVAWVFREREGTTVHIQSQKPAPAQPAQPAPR